MFADDQPSWESFAFLAFSGLFASARIAQYGPGEETFCSARLVRSASGADEAFTSKVYTASLGKSALALFLFLLPLLPRPRQGIAGLYFLCDFLCP